MFAECSFGKAGKWKIVRQSWRMSDSGLDSWLVIPWLYGGGVLHIDVIAHAGVQSKGALAVRGWKSPNDITGTINPGQRGVHFRVLILPVFLCKRSRRACDFYKLPVFTGETG